MKPYRIFYLGCLVLTLALCILSGCSTTPRTQTDANKIARASAVAHAAAFTACRWELADRPGDRAYWLTAKNALDDLLKAQNYDPVAFRNALSALPIKELRSDVGTLAIEGAITLYDGLANQSVNLQGQVWLAPIMTAVRDGIAKALELSKPQARAPIETFRTAEVKEWELQFVWRPDKPKTNAILNFTTNAAWVNQ